MIRRLIIAGVAVLLLVYGLAFLLVASLSQALVLDGFLSLMPQEKMKGVNILAFGIDDTKRTKRSDALIVVHLDKEKNRIGVLSIPRDTRANVEGHGITKLNHAYAYGGTGLLVQSVSEFLNIPIHHHIKIDSNGIEKFIDQLGGISLDVEKNLYYVDQAGDLYIDIKEGEQTLSGKQAVAFLRFRQDNEGDIGRVRRHREFLHAVSEKLFNPVGLLKLPAVVKQIANFIQTDISKRQMIGLASQFYDAFKADNMVKGTVPGAVATINGVSYWRPDFIALDRTIDTTLFGFETNKTVTQTLDTPDESAQTHNRRRVTLREVKRVTQQDAIIAQKEVDTLPVLNVEILNGNGKGGIARKAADVLIAKGLTVPFFGNAANYNYEQTMLVDWKGNVQDVLVLAKWLNIKPENIIVYNRPDKPLDVTVVLGHDWGVSVGGTQ